MLTPQEVQDKKFKQAFVGGYDMAVVDEFLEAVTADYTSLFKENAVLKNKMKVLVEKIEEYRQNDDAIRQAYLAIKRQAEKELEATRAEASRLMNEATGEMSSVKHKLAGEIADEEKRLALAREQTAAFIATLRKLYQSQMEYLTTVPGMEIVESPRQKRDAAVRETVVAIDRSIAPEIDVPDMHGQMPDLAASTIEFDIEGPVAGSYEDSLRKQEEIVENFEIHFASGVLDDDIWESEHDTATPQPKFEFPNLERQFGSDASLSRKKTV